MLFLFAAAPSAPAADVDVSKFTEYAEGNFQVFAQSGRPTARNVNLFMNLMLDKYGKFFSNWSQRRVAQVVVFGNEPDFRGYLGRSYGLMHPWLAAVCVPKADASGQRYFELVVHQNQDLYRDLAHEGFHQFIWYELGDHAPTWFNEGMAQYFETSSVLHGELRTGEISRPKLQAAQAILRREAGPKLAELIAMDKATFYRDAQVTYPLAWALAHYLMQRERRTYRDTDMREYVQDLKHGRDPVKQFWAQFGRDTNQLERDFASYILRLRARFD